MIQALRRARRAALFVFGLPLACGLLVAFLVALAGAVPAEALAAERPRQTQGGCGAFVDGQPTTSHASPQDALELDVDSVHRVQARAPADANTVRIEVETPIGSVTALEAPVAPGTEYDNPNFRIDDKVAPYGVGLYKVEVTAGSCEETVWVHITGRSPLTTVTGIAGTTAAVVGVLMLVWGIVRAVKGRGGIVRGAIGGALGGIGALLLSQQFGWIGITPTELITWVVLPALGGAAVTGITTALSGGGAAAAGRRSRGRWRGDRTTPRTLAPTHDCGATATTTSGTGTDARPAPDGRGRPAARRRGRRPERRDGTRPGRRRSRPTAQQLRADGSAGSGRRRGRVRARRRARGRTGRRGPQSGDRAPGDQRRSVHAGRAGRRRRVLARRGGVAPRPAGHRGRAVPVDDVPPYGPSRNRPTCGRARSRRCTRSTGRPSASRSEPSRSSRAPSCSSRRRRRWRRPRP